MKSPEGDSWFFGVDYQGIRQSGVEGVERMKEVKNKPFCGKKEALDTPGLRTDAVSTYK